MDHNILKVDKKEYLPTIMRFNAIKVMTLLETEHSKLSVGTNGNAAGWDSNTYAWEKCKDGVAEFIKFWKEQEITDATSLGII